MTLREELLRGGDRRSVARSKEAQAMVLANPDLVNDLAALAEDEDWLVSMRALDLLEKLVHRHGDWVQPHKRLFIGSTGPLLRGSESSRFCAGTSNTSRNLCAPGLWILSPN